MPKEPKSPRPAGKDEAAASPPGTAPARRPRPGLKAVAYRDIGFQIAHKPGAPTYFVLGVRKSGSTILNKMIRQLGLFNGQHFVDIPGVLFSGGLIVADWQKDREVRKLVRPGNVYGGFRTYPICLHGMPLFRDSPKIFMMRDPRDALVSEYFSSAYSHQVPKGGKGREHMLKRREATLAMAIDDYVIQQAPQLKRTLRQYRFLDEQPHVLSVRYEDRILDKSTLIREICTHFGWSVTDEQLREILSWADVVPTKEQPTEFVRKVTPGDHRDKLSEPVIRRLNRIFADELGRYGYA